MYFNIPIYYVHNLHAHGLRGKTNEGTHVTGSYVKPEHKRTELYINIVTMYNIICIYMYIQMYIIHVYTCIFMNKEGSGLNTLSAKHSSGWAWSIPLGRCLLLLQLHTYGIQAYLRRTMFVCASH